MATEEECVCCMENDCILDKILSHKHGDIRCITEHRGFASVCLDEDVLEAAYYTFRQYHGRIQASENE
jgi:hypothetical protein